MLSKVSSHLGPTSFFSGNVAPSLVLSLDAGNPLSYGPTGFTVSGGSPSHTLLKRLDDWNVYGDNYLQGGTFSDGATPQAGWYIVDDNGTIRQVLSDVVWFSGGNPTPIDNGGGWFMVLDGPWTISNSQSSIEVYETLPTVTYIYDGVTWFDLTGFNNDISLTNITYNPTYSQLTNFQGSFQFDGTSSFGSLISGTAIPLGDSHYTIEAWIQSNSYSPSENGGIIGWGTYGGTFELNSLGLSGNGFINSWFDSSLTAIPATVSNIYFYHVVSTYNGTTRTIYLNGENIGSDVPGVSHSTTNFDNLTIGLTDVTADEYFNGNIAKLKIWNKSLSDTQILNSFNSSKSYFGYSYGSLTFNYAQNPYLISSSSDYAFGTGDFTIEAFFNLNSSPYFSFGGIVSLRGNGSFTDGVNINLQQLSTSSPLVEFSVAGTFVTATASLNKWYHAAISRIGGTSSLYLSGQLVSEIADSSNYANNDLVIGRYYTDLDTHYINGIVSNVRVINGTGIYTGSSITVPTSYPLGLTGSDTKLLIDSKEIVPTIDSSTYSNSVTASNIGWTSSLPQLFEFNYPNFSSTDGLELVSCSVISNQIYLTTNVNSDTGNVYKSTSTNYNRDFSLEWNFECSGGNGADGFCVQWTTQNNTVGGAGGDVGADYSAINLFQFKTYSNNLIKFYHSNVFMSTQGISPFTFRQNAYYWLDYNYATSTVYIYYSTTSTKPVSPNHTFTSVTFDSGNYYLGFGAACGGSNDNHILKSLKLTFL